MVTRYVPLGKFFGTLEFTYFKVCQMASLRLIDE